MTPIDGKADPILSGGPVWCGLAQGAAEALALRDGKVLAAGRLSDVEMLAGPGTRRIDLRGRLAIPAFHDAHMHLMSLGRRAKSLDISPGASERGATSCSWSAHGRRAAPGTWITGSGYDHDRLVGKRHPDALGPRQGLARSPGLARPLLRPHGRGQLGGIEAGRHLRATRRTRRAASSCARTASRPACCRSARWRR